MAKQTYATEHRNPQMMFVTSFVTMAIVNFIVFAVANLLFPTQVVLGTMTIPVLEANLLTSATLSVMTILLLPFFTELELRRNRLMSPAEWMSAYLAINFVFVWLLTRRSEIFGLGVSSWLVIVGLAVVLDFLQGMVMMKMGEIRVKRQLAQAN